MNLLSYGDVETYLARKQVYFKKEIANINFQTIASSDRVHQVGRVEVRRLNNQQIAFSIQINDLEATLIEYKSDLELFAWIKTNFIPVSELLNGYLQKN